MEWNVIGCRKLRCISYHLNGFWSTWYGSVSLKWHFRFYWKVIAENQLSQLKTVTGIESFFIANFSTIDFFVNWMGYLQSFRVWVSSSLNFQFHARTFQISLNMNICFKSESFRVKYECFIRALQFFFIPLMLQRIWYAVRASAPCVISTY